MCEEGGDPDGRGALTTPRTDIYQAPALHPAQSVPQLRAASRLPTIDDTPLTPFPC